MRYAICTAPRCGAHWLGSLLRDRSFGPCDEWAEPRTGGVPQTDRFGWIIHRDHLGSVDLDQFDRFILLTRRKVNDQAESWAGARLSGRWFDGSTRGIAPATPDMVEHIKASNAKWRAILKPRKPIKVTCEQLLADPDTVADDIAAALLT